MTELYSYLESSAVQPRGITSLARYAARMEAGVHPLIRHLAEAEPVRATQSLRDWGTAGQLCYEDGDWLLALAESASDGFAERVQWFDQIWQRAQPSPVCPS